MKIARISWRSLWRNSTRTNVTITAVALCIAILIIFQSLIIGLIEKAVYNTTNLVVGEVQIHATGYLDDRSIYKSLKNIEKIRAVAKENNIGMVERSYGFGLISSGTKSAWFRPSSAPPAILELAVEKARNISPDPWSAMPPVRPTPKVARRARRLS